MEQLLNKFKTLPENDLNHRGQNGDTLIMFFCKTDTNSDIVNALLNNPAIDINIKNNDGKTALHFAVENKATKIAKLLIEKNITILPDIQQKLEELLPELKKKDPTYIELIQELKYNVARLPSAFFH